MRKPESRTRPTMHESPQLPLDIRLDGASRLDQFVAGPNAACVAFLQRLADHFPEPLTYLDGETGSGKTHLLQGVCGAAHRRGSLSAYVPLAETGHATAGLLEGLERFSLVCIDDVDRLPEPCEADLFRLVNRLREAGGRLLVSARVPVTALPIRLPDLRSRLSWGPSFTLQPLDDDDKLAVLQQRARLRGFELPEETGRYLLRRCERSLPYLTGLLDRLDRASLAAQRRVTVPFARQMLDAEQRDG